MFRACMRQSCSDLGSAAGGSACQPSSAVIRVPHTLHDSTFAAAQALLRTLLGSWECVVDAAVPGEGAVGRLALRSERHVCRSAHSHSRCMLRPWMGLPA